MSIRRPWTSRAMGRPAAAHGTGPPDYGKSRNSTGFPLRLHIDDSVERHIDDVGRRVKRRMFPHRPPFVFNAVACVGDFDRDGRQKYTNPDSPWFNVFLGYYQLDCRKALWGRPFGFESASLAASQPCIDDLVRLGKADWNYFSAWDCGVPEDVVDRYCGHDIDPVRRGGPRTGRDRGREWRHLELLDLTVASAYIAAPPAGSRWRTTGSAASSGTATATRSRWMATTRASYRRRSTPSSTWRTTRPATRAMSGITP